MTTRPRTAALRKLARQSRRPRALAAGAIAALALTGGTVAASTNLGGASAPANQPAAVQATNPFNLSGPVAGRHSEFGVPAFEGRPTETSTADLKRDNSRAGVLKGADAAQFAQSRAFKIQRADGKFATTAEYARDGATLRIETWVPDGAFTLFAPLASPVKEIKQTVISGHPAVTILSTDLVVSGNPPRQVYVEVSGVWYAITGEGLTSNQAMLDLVQGVIEEVSS